MSTFIKFQTLAKKQFDAKIKCLQSNNGGKSKVFASFLTKQGIIDKCSCPHTSKQNGRSERKIRHIFEINLTLLAIAVLPSKFSLYAFQTATFLINRLPTKTLNLNSPFQTLFGHSPNYTLSKVFGCLCFPYIWPYNNHKLQYKLVQCLF